MALEENKVSEEINKQNQEDAKKENTDTSSEKTEKEAQDNTSVKEVSKDQPKDQINDKDSSQNKAEENSEKNEESNIEEPEKPSQKSKEDELLEEKVEELSDSDKNILLAELRQKFDEGTAIEVNVLSKAIGGLRVIYKKMPMFLPTSHFSMKRSTSDEELQESVGSDLKVNIHEIKEENNQVTVIVTRKKILQKEFWDSINVGDKVTGTVTSTPAFGVFLDIGGVEGLCHVSRLAHERIANPATFCKPGDKMDVVITEIDQENGKISLSRQELQPSPWEGIEEEIKPETIVKGIVRRITDFGVYVELKKGVDGLLRNAELSWTKRVSDPKSMLKKNQQIDVYVMEISEEKQTATLSLRRTQENPWDSLDQRFPINSVYHAEAVQVNPKGAIFALNDEVDGFMPKSKMRGIAKGNKVPFQKGDKVEVKVTEIVPSNESLILAPQGYEEQPKGSYPKSAKGNFKKGKESSSFTLGDLLGEKMKDSLKNFSN